MNLEIKKNETKILDGNHPELNITIKKGIQTTILDKTTNKQQNITIALEENSILKILSLKNNTELKKEIIIKQNAQCTTLDILQENTNFKITSILEEEGAKSIQKAIVFGEDNNKSNITTEAIHKNPHTESFMLTKSILKEEAQQQAQGKINIEAQAHNCIAHQKTETLLIGEKAKINTVPILEVNNDDVTCSHGATITNLDEEQLFYSEARGIPEDLARQLIIQGFTEPILKEFPEEMKELIK